MNGTVEALTPDWRGATLVTAVGSVLTVDDVADFDEQGGWLTIADAAPLEYIAVDEDADTVTLTGTAGTVEAGDPVAIWDPTVPPSGAKVVEYLASVMTDRGPVDAVIEHEKIPLAGVDTLVGASVSLTEDTYGTPYVDQVLGREPQIDGAFIDPTSTIPGGQAFSLDAPTATDGYPEDYGWWQVDATGKVLGFWRLVGGVWTAQTIVTAEALKANNAIITALTGETITGATIQTRATQDRGIKLGTVNGVESFIIYSESGVPFVKAIPTEGLAVIAGEVKANSLTVSPTSAEEGASLGGVTEVTRHPDGSPGVLRLTGYTTPPKSAPTVTGGYDTVQFTDDDKWADRHGWSTDGTYWYTALIVSGDLRVEKWSTAGTLQASGSLSFVDTVAGCVVSSGYLYALVNNGERVDRFNASTLVYVDTAYWTDGLLTGRNPTIGVDSTNGNLLLAQAQPSQSDHVRFRRYTWPATNLAPLTLVGTFVDTAFGFDQDLAGVLYGTHDLGVNRYIFANRGGGLYQVVDTSGAAASAEFWESGMGAKIGFTYTGGAFVSMDATGLMRTYTGQDKATVAGSASMTKWVSNTLANATLETTQSPRAKITPKKRSKLNVTTTAINTGGTNAPDRVKIYVGQDRSATVGTTNASPNLSGTFTAADVGSAVVGSGIQVGTTIISQTGTAAVMSKNATATAGSVVVTLSPDRAGMWKQTDPATGVITTSYPSLATSGTNPPSANGFQASVGTIQRLELSDGTVFVDGVGGGAVPVGAWTAYTPTLTSNSVALTLASFTRMGRYIQIGKTVHFVAVIIATAASGYGTGGYAFGLPVAARTSASTFPGDEVVVHASQSGPNHAYVGRAGASVNEVSLFLTSTDALATSANTGMATGTIIRISGTYEAA